MGRRNRKKREPIFYGGLDRNLAHKYMAPELLERANQGRCHYCNKRIVMLAEHFEMARRAARRSNRPFLLICCDCADKEIEKPADCNVLVMPMSEERRQIQNRFEAQLN